MKIKPLPPEVMMSRFAKLLYAVSHEAYVPLIELATAVGTHGRTAEEHWDGMVRVVVRLSDIRVTITQFRQVLPLLKLRTDLIDLLAGAILVARRDRLDAFLADLPEAAAIQYELLAMFQGVLHHGLTVLPPTQGESWRLEFLMHAAAVSEVLNQEMQRVATEGETAMDKK